MSFAAASAVLVLSILIDLVFADPPTSIHPVGWQGLYISAIWRKRRTGGSTGLFLYGSALLISGLLITGLISGLFMVLVNRFAGAGLLAGLPGIILVSLMLKGSFSYRGLIKAGLKVRDAIDRGDIDEGRRLVSRHLVSRPTGSLSVSGINSAVIESLAENFTDSVASPLLWFSFGGPVAAWCFRFTNTADAMLGYRDGDREWGGKSAALLDDVLNWVPSRMAGWTIISASLIRRLNFREAVRIMLRDSRNCASPNSGWTMAAAAGALGIRLEKEGHYVMNAEGRPPESSDIGVLNGVLDTALILWLIPVAGVLLLSSAATAVTGFRFPLMP